MVTVIPFNVTYEDSYNRSAYCLRLTGLPPNTNARDLDEVGKTIKAKTWTIPRSKFNYNYLRFAFFNFATEHDYTEALNTPMGLGTTKLSWAKDDAQLCGRCASANHLSKDCPEKRPAVNRDFAKLYEKFKPAQFRSFKINDQNKNRNNNQRGRQNNQQNNQSSSSSSVNHNKSNPEVREGRSYAHVTNPNAKPPSKHNNNIENGTKAGGSMHETTETFDAAAAHRTLMKHLQDIKSQMNKMNVVLERQDKRIKIVEEKHGIKRPASDALPMLNSDMEIDEARNEAEGSTAGAFILNTVSKVTNDKNANDNHVKSITNELKEENLSLKEALSSITKKYNELIDVLGSATGTKIEKIPGNFITSLSQTTHDNNHE